MLEYKLEELYTRIPNLLPFDERLSNEAVTLYYYIAECNTLANYAVISMRNVLSQFKYKNVDRYYNEYIEALKELRNADYISILDMNFEIVSTEDITKDKVLYIDVNIAKDEYFPAYLQDVHSIMNYAIKNQLKRRTSIIRHYLAIQRWTNFKYDGDAPSEAEQGRRIAYYTVSQANRHIGIDASTYKKYNEILQELGIFYFDSSYMTRDLKNTPTKFVRTRLWEEDEFREHIEQIAKDKKQFKYNKDIANKRRSNTQKKNYAKKKQVA